MTYLSAKIISFGDFFKPIFESVFGAGSRNFLDILIISFLIYIVIKLLRETHSAPVAGGVLTLLGFYGVALLFDLPLTSLVLRSFFGIFLVVIAVVFQRELRRFFSSFGFSGFARRFKPPSEETIETIIRAIGQLLREKTGALIVFPGREPAERHFEGGFRLNGEVSEPLLLSIFDKTSPGHDGAAIVENNKIKRFAVHLPLAEQIDKVRNFGLRHRAALGLAERSDAIVVVVSEERGVISIAQNRELKQIGSENELKQKLVDFYREKFARLDFANFVKWLGRNIFLLAFSFSVALGIFFLVNSSFATVQRNFIVTPEFSNVPSDIIINDVVPQEVILTLQGRSSDFSGFQVSDLKVSIDINEINLTKQGWHKALIDAKNIKKPFNLSVIKIDPASLQIQTLKNNPPPSSKK